jgi:hypothetical protein
VRIDEWFRDAWRGHALRLLDEGSFTHELVSRGLDLSKVVQLTAGIMEHAWEWHEGAHRRRFAPKQRDRQELLLQFRKIARKMNLAARDPLLARRLKMAEEQFAERGGLWPFPPLASEGRLSDVPKATGPEGGRPKKHWKSAAMRLLNRRAKVPVAIALEIVAAIDKMVERGYPDEF